MGDYSMEVLGNNRSVMPLDVLGRTRATLIVTACSINNINVLVRKDTGNHLNTSRKGDSLLQPLT